MCTACEIPTVYDGKMWNRWVLSLDWKSEGVTEVDSKDTVVHIDFWRKKATTDEKRVLWVGWSGYADMSVEQ